VYFLAVAILLDVIFPSERKKIFEFDKLISIRLNIQGEPGIYRLILPLCKCWFSKGNSGHWEER
jgi:hypothetical protein